MHGKYTSVNQSETNTLPGLSLLLRLFKLISHLYCVVFLPDRYAKREKGKLVSTYSAKDMAEIMGHGTIQQKNLTGSAPSVLIHTQEKEEKKSEISTII